MPTEGEVKETPETENEGHEAEATASTEVEQDDVGDDGEGASEDDGSEVEEGQVALVGDGEKPRSRGETRFQKLSNSAREAGERAATAERKAQELERRLSQLEQPRETPDQIAQRLALMTPEERLEYKLDQAERRNEQRISALTFQNQDVSDRSAFSSLCTSNPTAARYRDRVEQRLGEIRSQGQNVSRESLFKFLVGEDVVAKVGAAKAKQTRDGERRIKRESVLPGNSRGDSAPNKRGEQSAEDKLANVTF